MMRPRQLGLLLIVLIASGCGTGGGAAAPSADLARQALEKSLTAWKEGKQPGMIEGTNPSVQAVDSKWLNGQKLSSFEIVKEEPAETERRFAVKLTHGAAGAPEEVNYMVVGNGPIWVYRDEDYQRMLNMDNSPTSRPTRRPSR
jgi:hypothetical protein